MSGIAGGANARDALALYDAYRDRIDTGDLIGFRGGPPLSWVLRSTHVGIAIRDRANDTVLLWESCPRTGLKDAVLGIHKSGVQLVELGPKLAAYNGQAWVRRLAPSLSDEQRTDFGRIRQELHGRSYETNPIEFCGAIVKWVDLIRSYDSAALFCSELAARTYIEWGVLSRRRPPDKYSPDDFLPGEWLPTLGLYTFGAPVCLRMGRKSPDDSPLTDDRPEIDCAM